MRELFQDMKTWRFWRHYCTKSFAVVGTIVALIQSIVMFFPTQAHLLGGTSFIASLAISLVAGLVLTWPRPIESDYSSPETKISVVKGDLFKQETNLVIGVCNTFDTEIPHIIERASLLGQAIDKLYGGSWKELDGELNAALRGKVPVGGIEKSGKTVKYEVGTVVTLQNGARKVYFSAYADMDKDNKASSEIETLTKSLFDLWAEVTTRGNGKPVSISPWGGGLSRISSVLPAQDSIRLIILSFMFCSRKQKVSDELRIVVPEAIFKRLDRLELQAFLSSLRKS